MNNAMKRNDRVSLKPEMQYGKPSIYIVDSINGELANVTDLADGRRLMLFIRNLEVIAPAEDFR